MCLMSSELRQDVKVDILTFLSSLSTQQVFYKSLHYAALYIITIATNVGSD